MKLRKIVKWGILFGFILLNFVAYNHAYKFTHFMTKTTDKKVKPEDLSFGQKLKLVFTGVDNPKPVNDRLPNQPFEIVEIESDVLLKGWLIVAKVLSYYFMVILVIKVVLWRMQKNLIKWVFRLY